MNCLWCNDPFEPVITGGHEKKFCSDCCRYFYHYSLRLWAQKAADAGLLPIEALRQFAPEPKHYDKPPYTTPGEPRGLSVVSG